MWWMEVTSIIDLGRLVKFEKKVHLEKDWMSVEEYVVWHDRGLRTTVLLDDTGEWKGSYQIIDTGDTIKFFGFGRNPEYTGKRVGQLLMNRMLSKTRGKALVCETRQDNHRMNRLIKDNGFVITHEEDHNNERWMWWRRDSV